jgi:hypothetical protein
VLKNNRKREHSFLDWIFLLAIVTFALLLAFLPWNKASATHHQRRPESNSQEAPLHRRYYFPLASTSDFDRFARLVAPVVCVVVAAGAEDGIGEIEWVMEQPAWCAKDATRAQEELIAITSLQERVLR